MAEYQHPCLRMQCQRRGMSTSDHVLHTVRWLWSRKPFSKQIKMAEQSRFMISSLQNKREFFTDKSFLEVFQ
jgi:hypothetical protein